jgi:Fe-S cluster biogenesis protein NfuA
LSTTRIPEAVEVDLHAVAHRIEELLEQLQSVAGARVWPQVEELVRALTDLYGAGLGRTVELADVWARMGAGTDLLDELAGDELVASLLLLHDLHPQSLSVRAGRAVDAAVPLVRTQGGDLRLVGVDSGVVHVSVSVTATGCGSDPNGLAEVVRNSLGDALPDATSVEVDVEVDHAPVETPIRLSRKRAPAGAGP